MDETPSNPPPACTTLALAELLRRWREEDDLTARTDLLNLSQERVERVARNHLRFRFLDLKTKGVQTHAVQTEAYLRMRAWVEETLRTPFASVAAYFEAVRTIICRVLTDFALEYRDPRKSDALLDEVPAPPPGDAPPSPDTIGSMWELVGQLPPREREAIELRYWLDLSLADIRDVMRLTDETAVHRLIRAGQVRLRELAARVGFEG